MMLFIKNGASSSWTARSNSRISRGDRDDSSSTLLTTSSSSSPIKGIVVLVTISILLLVSNSTVVRDFEVYHDVMMMMTTTTTTRYTNSTTIALTNSAVVSTTTTQKTTQQEKEPPPQSAQTQTRLLLPPLNYKRALVPNPKLRIGPNGERGYVHDPSYIRTHSPRIESSSLVFEHYLHKYNITFKEICAPLGNESQYAIDKIRNHIESNIPHKDQQRQQDKKRDVKVFCAIYTYAGGVQWTDAIWDSWGKRCDGILFASTVSNLTTQHVHIPHPMANSKNGRYEGKYMGMWQKVRSMHAYIYENNFVEDYDYFYFCGDDTYLIVDNLKEFLSSEDVQTYQHQQNGGHFYSGYWIYQKHQRWPNGFFYMGGGSGYVMSRETLIGFAQKVLPECKHSRTKGSSNEDVKTAYCLRRVLNVTGYDSRDSTGAHRFHQLMISVHATQISPHITPGKRFKAQTRFIKQTLENMNQVLNWTSVWQQDYISNSSIAFHKHYNPYMLLRMDHLLYGTYEQQCQQGYDYNNSTTKRNLLLL